METLKTSISLFLLLTFFGINSSFSQAAPDEISLLKKTTQKNFTNPPVLHTIWNELLDKHVSVDGHVSYEGLMDDKAKLKEYLDLLSTAHPNDTWSEHEQKAYWINAYNAFTVKLILDNYPINSIKEIKKDSKSPWDIQFINIESELYTLNDIEHKILKPKFNDPRIHFALNCASYSCPILLNKAFTIRKLDKTLTTITKNFINDPLRNTIDKSSVQISELFKWYNEDFTKDCSLIEFINKYSEVKVDSNATIEYMEYIWELNE